MHQIKYLSFLITIIFVFITFGYYDRGIPQQPQSHFIPQSAEERRLASMLHGHIIQGDLSGLMGVLDLYPQYINVVQSYSAYHDSFTLLQQAARLRRDNFVDELLDRGANPFLLTLDERDSILHLSTISGNTAKKFIGLGLNIEARNAKGMTPLLAHVSRRFLNTEAIHDLLAAKADVEAKAPQKDYTALHILFNPYHFDHDQENLLIVLRSILDHGGRLKARTKEQGATPLHFAAERNNVKAIEILVKKAEQMKIRNFINITDSSISTALFIAYVNQSSEAITELLRLGANPFLKNKLGLSVNGEAHKQSANGSPFGKFVLDEIDKHFQLSTCAPALTKRNERPSYVSN